MEAPGLYHYFRQWVEPSQKGLLELIHAAVAKRKPDWREYISPVRLPGFENQLQLMSSGKDDETYISRYRELNWEQLYQDKEIQFGSQLELLREDWVNEFDFVLIDSRTGISDIGGICTIQLPDILVFGFTANSQSLEGVMNVVKRAVDARNRVPYDRAGLLTVPLICRFDAREEYERAQKWQKEFAQKLKPFYGNWLHRQLSTSDILDHTTIPYFSYWSFGEEIPVMAERSSNPEYISYHMDTVAALIAHRLGKTHLLANARDTFVESAQRMGRRGDIYRYDFYISPCRESEKIAQKLAQDLKAMGKNVYVEGFAIKATDTWTSGLDVALDQSQHLVILVGMQSDSRQDRELGRFIKQTIDEKTSDRKILPVLLDNAYAQNLPNFLSRTEFLSLQDLSMSEIIQQIAKEVDSPRELENYPNSSAKNSFNYNVKTVRTNYKKAQKLLETLFDPGSGAQREYKFDPKVDNESTRLLTQYGRVWTYTQGKALILAVRSGQNEKAFKLADWLCSRAVLLKVEKGQPIYGGWHFSVNTISDTYKDPRLSTGANAWALRGLAVYIANVKFNDTEVEHQEKIKECFANNLKGLLFLQDPSSRLFTAGWLPYVLANRDQDPYLTSIDQLVMTLGHENDPGFKKYSPSLTRIVRDSSINIEHNIAVLSVLNFVIKEFNRLPLLSIQDMVKCRKELISGIFNHLYDENHTRFITGIDRDGQKEIYTAWNSSSRLALAMDVWELDSENRDKLAAGMLTSCKKFVKDIEFEGVIYYGAHYYEDDYSVPYTNTADQNNPEKAYNLEATSELLLSLREFARGYPEDQYAPCFRYIADNLWKDMQRFVFTHGFLYTTQSVQGYFEPLESSTATIFFIEAFEYYAIDGHKVDESLTSDVCQFEQVEGIYHVHWEDGIISGWVRGLDFSPDKSYQVSINYHGDVWYNQGYHPITPGNKAFSEGYFSKKRFWPVFGENYAQVLKLIVFDTALGEGKPVYTKEILLEESVGNWPLNISR